MTEERGPKPVRLALDRCVYRGAQRIGRWERVKLESGVTVWRAWEEGSPAVKTFIRKPYLRQWFERLTK
jgi:hypothetical protein